MSAQSSLTGSQSRNTEFFRSLTHATPASLLLTTLFFLPILILFWQSATGGTFDPYFTLVEDTFYLHIFWRTIRLSLAVSAVCLLLALPVAIYMTQAGRRTLMVAWFFVLLPLWSSQLVRTYAWLILLGRNGVINKTLMAMGILDRPLTMLNTEIAVHIGMIHVMLPFMVLPVFSALHSIDKNLYAAARGLGAGSAAVLWRITLPLAMPGILAGFSLVFVICMGIYIMPAVLGGGKVPVIAMIIDQQTRQFLNWPLAGALSLSLLAVVLLIFWLINGAARKLFKET